MSERLREIKRLMPLVRYADTLATLHHFRSVPQEEILRRLSVEDALWREADVMWNEELALAARRNQRELALQFSARFGDKRRRLARDGVLPEPCSGELPAASKEVPRQVDGREPLRASFQLGSETSQPNYAGSGAIAVTYTVDLEPSTEASNVKGPVVPGLGYPALDLDSTAPLDPRFALKANAKQALPFVKQGPAVAPAPLPIADQSGETAMIDVSAFRAQYASASARVGLREGTPLESSAVDGGAAIHMSSTGESLRAGSAPVEVLPMPVERFAVMQAALSSGQPLSEVLHRFGVGAPEWPEIVDRFANATSDSPVLRAQYEGFLRKAHEHRR